nr:GFA family protein [Sphingomonas brevis]
MSVCHCLNCQKRSGSAFAAQARWPAEQVTLEGRSSSFELVGDSGKAARFYFCPECGSDVYYDNNDRVDGQIAIPLGAFDDPYFLTPNYSIYESRKHGWVEIVGDGVEHD